MNNKVDYEILYDFSHTILKSIIKTVPSCKVHVLKEFELIYPYMLKDEVIQQVYIQNILKASNNYMIDCRLKILEICVQKMLKLDVNATREHIIEEELKYEQQLIDTKDQNDEKTNHLLADKLDIKMKHLFEFIHANTIGANDEQCWERTKSIYRDILFVFDKYILCTYGSTHVQFIMFYICSFKSQLTTGFIDYLWNKFTNTNTSSITKQVFNITKMFQVKFIISLLNTNKKKVCAYYLGSFIARAKYLTLSTCIVCLQLFVDWIHNYITRMNNNDNKNINLFQLHRPFYSLCQTLFYVIVFRHSQLFNEDDNILGNYYLKL
jgi:RNA polymerase I-specific transcription initiation factor RRN3